MSTNRGILLITILATGFVFSSCRKSDRDNDTETTSSTDNAIAETAFSDVFNIVQSISDTTPGMTFIKYNNAQAFSSCPVVNITPAYPDLSFPKTMIIDYGSGCTDLNGVNRKGIINAIFTGKLKTPGSSVNITFSNYYLNGRKITGAKSVANNGYNSDSNLVFIINVKNASISGSEGTISWSSKRQRIWTAGDTTQSKTDDVFLITGTAQGTGSKGTPFDIEITDALEVKGNCNYITKGKFTLTPEHFAPRYFDFGTGSCDNSATVTINGKSYSISY